MAADAAARSRGPRFHHGLPAGLLTPQLGVKQDYLAFVGRITPEKGADRAIRIARASGIPLRIAAKVDKADQIYFETTIRPMLAGGGVEIIGEISDAERPAFLSGAVGLLMSIDWPEPFGLVMIEAMACGTPVIAFDRGFVPEIIEDGHTGFIVEDELGSCAAVSRLGRLSREQVRARFDERLTARRMAKDYFALYRSLATEEHTGLIDDPRPGEPQVRGRDAVAALGRLGFTSNTHRASSADALSSCRFSSTSGFQWSKSALMSENVHADDRPQARMAVALALERREAARLAHTFPTTSGKIPAFNG